MEHFPIVQALCRTALAHPTAAARKQVERLRDALVDAGDQKAASSIASLLTQSERTIDVAPSRLSRSRADMPGETLTPKTQLPVDRETAALLVEVIFPHDLSTAPPLFNRTIAEAIQSVIEEWRNFADLKEMDVQPSRTCLIYGAPGTGKTRLALWIANQLEMPVVLARIDGLVSSFLGTTSRNIGSLFAFANRYRCILLLDEFDAVAKLRDDPQEVGEIKRVVNSLLQNLDSRRDLGITIGVTNHQNLLDPAVWRRFEIQLEIPKPDFEVRVEIARSFMPPYQAPEKHLRLLAWFTEGATGAEIEALVRTYKKSLALRGSEPKHLLDTLRQFATLNSARLNPKRRELLFAENRVLFKEWSRDAQLQLSYDDIGKVAGKDKSTISRQIGKSGPPDTDDEG
ncbi:MAG: AAA family ATPase [Salinarimonas sp.]